MSQVPAGGVDLCDNLPDPEAPATQTRNLNEKNALAQTQSLSPLESEEGVRHRLIQNASLNNNGQDEVEEQPKEGYMRSGDEDEDEDTDEVMKEEEESEESSALIGCQSPMTDSSYSETGSLLDTPHPFSPGTSPEPTSPVSPGTLYSIDPVDSLHSPTQSVLPLGHTSVDPPALTVTSGTMPTSPPRPTCIAESTDGKNTKQLTSFPDPALNHGPTCVGESATSYAEPQGPSRLHTTTASSTGPATFTTGLTTTSTDSTLNAAAKASNWEHITSMPVSTCTTGPVPSSDLLECLEQLAQRGDDTHFPQYLHQIAETFVRHKDYQQAVRCIQLERLYHQRVVDNLTSLQEQWESKCRGTSLNLETQHLDTLKHICLTHSRPRARDAVGVSLDCSSPTFEERVVKPACSSDHQVDRGMQKRVEDPSFSQISQAVIPFIRLADGLQSPEVSGKDGKLRERGSSQASPLTDTEQHSNREGGRTITVIGNSLHPSGAEGMEQSDSAEQQGGDSGPAPEKEVKRKEEERDVEEAVDALEMKDEGEEEEDEKQRDRDSAFCPETLPAETLVSRTEVEVRQLQQEAPVVKKLHEETQDNPPERQEERTEEEEDEEEEYEMEQADLIRDAASLDDMAKLITVEEVSPASGLVSILKKRNVCVDKEIVPAGSEPRSDKATAKRRVRFKVPDDGFEQDVGGGDSCLLLFLLCLVTVVISLGGTALYCALGDVHSSVCQDFSRNADFYVGQIQRGITQLQRWFTPAS